MNHALFAQSCFTKQANPLAQILAAAQANPEATQRLVGGAGGALAGGGLGALLGGGRGAAIGAGIGGGAGAFTPELKALIANLIGNQEQPESAGFDTGGNMIFEGGPETQARDAAAARSAERAKRPIMRSQEARDGFSNAEAQLQAAQAAAGLTGGKDITSLAEMGGQFPDAFKLPGAVAGQGTPLLNDEGQPGSGLPLADVK